MKCDEWLMSAMQDKERSKGTIIEREIPVKYK